MYTFEEEIKESYIKLNSSQYLSCCWGWPFNSKDEIVVVNPTKSFNNTLGSFLGVKLW